MEKVNRGLISGLLLIFLSFGNHSQAQVVSFWSIFDVNLHDAVIVEPYVTNQIGIYSGANCHAYSLWLAYGRTLPPVQPGAGSSVLPIEVFHLINNGELEWLANQSDWGEATHVLYYLETSSEFDPMSYSNSLHHSTIVSQFDCFSYIEDSYVQGRNWLSPAAHIHKVSDGTGSGMFTPRYFKYTPQVGSLIPPDYQPNCPWYPLTCQAIEYNPVTCADGEDGVVSVLTSINSGSTQTFSWSNGGTAVTLNNLTAGTYTVTVTESPTGSTCQSTITLVNPQPFVSYIATTDDNGSCFMNPWGQLWGGGTATVVFYNYNPNTTYSYQWDNRARNQTTQTATSLCSGYYEVTVTDNVTGCIEWFEFQVEEGANSKSGSGIANSSEMTSIIINPLNIYPNPNNGEFKISVENNSEISTIDIYNLMGEKVFNSDMNKTMNEIDISNQPKGVYFVEITIGDKIFNEKIIKN